jgi:hypothetical protein
MPGHICVYKKDEVFAGYYPGWTSESVQEARKAKPNFIKLKLQNVLCLKGMIPIFRKQSQKVRAILLQTIELQLYMINFQDIETIWTLFDCGFNAQSCDIKYQYLRYTVLKKIGDENIIHVEIYAYNIDAFSIIGKITPEPPQNLSGDDPNLQATSDRQSQSTHPNTQPTRGRAKTVTDTKPDLKPSGLPE